MFFFICKMFFVCFYCNHVIIAIGVASISKCEATLKVIITSGYAPLYFLRV
jgi:hypothetical protein